MVSPNDPTRTDVRTDVPGGVPTTGRGFVTREETVVAPAERAERLPALGGRSQVAWGSVVAGSIAIVAITILSSSMAFAFGVPGYSGGLYGWGSGIWSIITAAIAFGLGGYLAAYLSSSREWRYCTLHGVMAWALALPLIFLLFNGAISPFFFGGGSLMAAGVTRTAGVNPVPLGQPTWENLTGAAWGAFLSCLVGLIAAAIGGGAVVQESMRRRDRGDRTVEMNR